MKIKITWGASQELFLYSHKDRLNILMINGHRNRFATLEARLRLLSPANVLDRGYSITMDDATGKIIRDRSELKQGQLLKTRLKMGEIRSVVAE